MLTGGINTYPNSELAWFVEIIKKINNNNKQIYMLFHFTEIGDVEVTLYPRYTDVEAYDIQIFDKQRGTMIVEPIGNDAFDSPLTLEEITETLTTASLML